MALDLLALAKAVGLTDLVLRRIQKMQEPTGCGSCPKDVLPSGLHLPFVSLHWGTL
jgi:hypothetical protein